ncbi:MAG: autotransporter-associated beta strand repeat-containing protein [Thermogemmata sp.]|nr:autotransporter-associated beta strand repeat-containing protein [Gemmataceae bacterium]
MIRWIGLCLGMVGVLSGSARLLAQNYSWNNSSTTWENSASWSPAGVPGATDVAQFEVLGTVYPATLRQPVLNSSVTVRQLRLSSHAQFSGWSLSGSGTLAAGDTSTGNFGLMTQGTGTFTIDLGNGTLTSLTLNGPTGSTGGGMVVGSGTQLVLTGNTIAQVDGTAPITLRGGTLVLDNSAGNPSLQRLTTSNAIQLYGGGATIEFRGADSGSIFTGLTGTLAVGAGETRLRTVASGAGSLTVNFGALSRVNPSGHLFFENIGSGFIGEAGQPQVLFTTAPVTSQGMISTSTSTPIPWAVVARRSSAGSADVVGRWANYHSVNGVVATTTTSFTGNFNTASAGTHVLFIGPSQAGQTITLTGSNALASVVLEPQADNTTLSIGSGGQINTLGIMLSGSRDMTITGGSLFSTSTAGPRALIVVNPTTRLFTSSNLAAHNSPVTISGPGMVVLTGTSNQIAFSSPQNVTIGGGTLRATATNFNPVTATVSLRGGVLEYDISNGNYIFNLALGTGANQVNWTGANDFGSGGFSAYSTTAGRYLFVNLFGDARKLTWNNGAFVADGYALKFGSPYSNAPVAWQNPIQMDSLTPGRYLVREIQVIRGAGTDADRTILVGVISGSPTTDLLKTGSGTLELAAQNTYRGNTLIQAGTLIVSDNASIGTGASRSGDIIVGSGARLAGTGTLMPDDATGKQVIVQPGGTIRGGHPNESDAGLRTGVLAINGPLAIRSSAANPAILQAEVHRTGTDTANVSRLNVGAPFFVDLDLGSNKLVIELINPSGTPSLLTHETYNLPLITTTGDGRIRLNGAVLDPGTAINRSYYELRPSQIASGFDYTLRITADGSGGGVALVLTLVPVPEPSAILGTVAVVGMVGWAIRRRWKRDRHSEVLAGV